MAPGMGKRYPGSRHDKSTVQCALVSRKALYASASSNFSASPVYADGRIYFQNEAGAGFVVKRGTIFAMLAQNDLAERTLASYAVADNTLFIRSESHLWRLGTQAAP